MARESGESVFIYLEVSGRVAVFSVLAPFSSVTGRSSGHGMVSSLISSDSNLYGEFSLLLVELPVSSSSSRFDSLPKKGGFRDMSCRMEVGGR